MSVLELHDLGVGAGPRVLCSGLDLRLGAGEFWAILGPNGAGKTSLLMTLAGLRAATAGRVTVRGIDVHSGPRRKVARELGMVFQEDEILFPATVLEHALVGRHPHLGRWSWESSEDVTRARRALAEVGLSEVEARDVRTLSGGEQRRLALATLLVQDPTVLLLDEPTNHLDLHHRVAALKLLEDRARRGATVCAVLHEPNLAARFASHVLLLPGDATVDAGPADHMLTSTRLEALYAHPLHQLESPDGPVFVPQIR